MTYRYYTTKKVYARTQQKKKKKCSKYLKEDDYLDSEFSLAMVPRNGQQSFEMVEPPEDGGGGPTCYQSPNRAKPIENHYSSDTQMAVA